MFYTPERMLLPELDEFPAHLHIDVLPAHQGKGYGRCLITTFLEAAAHAGAKGAHVAVSPVNTRAQSFYLRVGFESLPISNGSYFGYRL